MSHLLYVEAFFFFFNICLIIYLLRQFFIMNPFCYLLRHFLLPLLFTASFCYDFYNALKDKNYDMYIPLQKECCPLHIK